MSGNGRQLVFSTRAYAPMAREVCSRGNFEAGELERKVFPDGELYSRVLSRVSGRDVVLLGGTISEADTLELYDLACGIVDAGAHRIKLVIPYFGYATMERAVKPGEVVTAKTRARLLSSLPLPGSGGQVILLDLHVEGIAWYFEGNLRPVHLQGRPVILEAIRELVDGEFVLACTDAGRAKWVESLANDLRVQASFVFKRRLDSGATEVTAVSAQVQGQHVVIYDDMVRTGGSLLGAAAAYRDAGARRISVVATHGLFADDAHARLEKSGLIDRVACTDSHPRAVALQSDFIRVSTVAGLLADFLGSEN